MIIIISHLTFLSILLVCDCSSWVKTQHHDKFIHWRTTSPGNISGENPREPSRRASQLSRPGFVILGQGRKNKSPLTGSLLLFWEISRSSAACLRLSRTIPPVPIEYYGDSRRYWR
ncbi:hypothetical protein BJX65DRAFT_271476 [Aspergillus insuetus]